MEVVVDEICRPCSVQTAKSTFKYFKECTMKLLETAFTAPFVPYSKLWQSQLGFAF